ncbi:MAG TPA: hypothetical protein VGP05_06270 [Pseudonocardia sp.]|nr:hypothetical protein [Pseudonocardia sp.]
MLGPRRPATKLVALAVLALAAFWGLGTAVPGLASASATGGARALPPSGERPVPADRATTPVPAAPTPRGARLELRVATMSPRVVTSTGPATLTLTGQLVNIGDQVVRDVEIRAQRGDRLRTEGDVRTALAGNAADDSVTPGFAPVTDELGPGQGTPVRFSVPVRGTGTSSLALQRTGVYELLINVNGAPDSGAQARLAGVRMLLPVLGLPAAEGGAPEPAAGEITGGPTPVSMLYPIADQPRRLPTGPGEPVLLGDDQLAASMGHGGRLDGLLGALETAAPAGSPVREAICLAVDPDLLRTAADMSTGYRVRPPDGQEVDGRGAAAAGQWLDRLRALAAGRCVVALPYADADLVALSRAGLDDLSAYATQDGAKIAAEILRTPVRTDTTWPAEGLLDERSLSDYVHNGGHEVVLSADAVAVSGRSSRSTAGGLVRLAAAGAEANGLLADPLVTLAARGQDNDVATGGMYSGEVGSDGSNRGLGALAGSVSPAGSGTPLSDQDAIGATAFRALNGPTSAASSSTSSSTSPLLVAPPHRWNTTGTDARELLGTLGILIATGRLSPAALPGTPATDAGTPSAAGGQPTASGAAAAGQSGTAPQAAPSAPAAPDPGVSSSSVPSSSAPSATLVYPLRAGAREVPGTITAELGADRDATDDLRSAAEAEPGVGATPAQVFDPVTEGLLRACSAVWRGNPDLAGVATSVITQRVSLLRSLVRVLEPPSPYALGDKGAPLPITLANGLPVAMRVRVALSDTPGLRTEPIPEQRIPPMGRLQLRVNTQLTRSGQFSVEARLTTLAGSPLGLPSRLQLRSTAYGTITLWLTGTAGLLLVILAVRRITRRLRGAPVGRRAEASPRPPVDPARPLQPADERPVRPGPSRASPVPTATRPGSRSVPAGTPSVQGNRTAPAGPHTPSATPSSPVGTRPASTGNRIGRSVGPPTPSVGTPVPQGSPPAYPARPGRSLPAAPRVSRPSTSQPVQPPANRPAQQGQAPAPKSPARQSPAPQGPAPQAPARRGPAPQARPPAANPAQPTQPNSPAARPAPTSGRPTSGRPDRTGRSGRSVGPPANPSGNPPSGDPPGNPPADPQPNPSGNPPPNPPPNPPGSPPGDRGANRPVNQPAGTGGPPSRPRTTPPTPPTPPPGERGTPPTGPRVPRR